MKLFSFKVKSITTGNEKLRESQIEIAQVTKKDEGIYKCEASNTYGSGVTRMAKVTVVERTTVKVIFTKKSYLLLYWISQTHTYCWVQNSLCSAKKNFFNQKTVWNILTIAVVITLITTCTYTTFKYNSIVYLAAPRIY